MVDSPPKVASPLLCRLSQCNCTADPCLRVNGLPAAMRRSHKRPPPHLSPRLLLPLVRTPLVRCEHRLRHLGCLVLVLDSSPRSAVIRQFCPLPVSVRKKCRCPHAILRPRACPKNWRAWILCPRRLTCLGNHPLRFYPPPIPVTRVSLRHQARHRNSLDRSWTYPRFTAILSHRGLIIRYQDNQLGFLTPLDPASPQ